MPPATDSGTALANLQNYQSKIVTPDQASQQANDQLGVNGAQQQVSGLRGAITRTTGLLNQVAPSVYGRTQNSLVTNAQATRQIGNEQAPIAASLDRQQQDYTGANSDLQNLLTQAQGRASNTLTAQNGQLSYLQQIYQDLQAGEQAKADETFRQAQLAEQKRQADLSASTARATANAGASPTFGGASLATSAKTVGNLGRNADGGYAVTDASGKPITLGQYYQVNGGGVQAVVAALQNGSPADKQKAANIIYGINSGEYNSSNLPSIYPQIFGG